MRARVLAGRTLVLALLSLSACSDHPRSLVGRWQAGGATLALDEEGGVQLTGPDPPVFLGPLMEARGQGRWEVKGGKLRIIPKKPGGPEQAIEHEYRLEEGGKVLGVNSWHLRRLGD